MSIIKRIGVTLQAWADSGIPQKDQEKLGGELFGFDREILDFLMSQYVNVKGIPDVQNNQKTFLDNNRGWVFAVNDKYAKAAMWATGGIYTQSSSGDKLVSNDSYLYDILENTEPIPMITDYKTTYGIGWLGNSYWYTPKNSFGLPAKIYYMEPEFGTMKIAKNSFNKIDGYYLHRNGGSEPLRFEPDEIVHFYYPSINSATYGRSPGAHIKPTIDLDNKYKEFTNTMIDKGGVFSGMLSPKEKFMGDQHEVLLKLLKERTGSKKTGGLLVPNTPLDFTPMQMSPKDMDYVEGQNVTRDEISQTYTLNKTIMGVTDDVNRANAEAGIYIWYLLGLMPFLKMYGQFKTRGIITPYDRKAIWKYDNVVPEDEKLQAEVHEILIRSGQLTPDESREIRDMRPYEGGIGKFAMAQRSTTTLKDVINKEVQGLKDGQDNGTKK